MYVEQNTKFFKKGAKMNICVSNLCWFFDDLEAFRLLKEKEVKKIEISPFKQFGPWSGINKRQLISFKKQIKNNFNLEVSSMQSIFYQKDINLFEDSEKFIEHFKKVIEISEILDNHYIVFGSPKTRKINNKSQAECESIFLEVFSKISDINPDIIIGIETNPKYYNNDFLTKYNHCHEVLKKMNKHNIVFHFDLACLSLEGDNPINIYNTEKKHIKHLHISTKDLKEINTIEVDNFVTNIDIPKQTVVSIEMLNRTKQQIQNSIMFLKKRIKI
jgi:sugar phosphate isomerase/epimerase